ncbi:C-type lectin domain family 14 member A [Lampris incognitus]|uniref:C-type lectin domain family 14 member A n=1 Tax=Lampris incognitus TaxID=2546036 RepID=UPI0024B4A62F|nr:C-type lectin domain family 14 member A [Lampris incognitus]
MDSWIYLFGVLLVETVATELYVVHMDQVKFDEAQARCAPDGFLTTLSTKQETLQVLQLFSSTDGSFNLWVGLSKAKNECVIQYLPLRGFKWTVDGSQKAAAVSWREEPLPMCTGTRCAVLSVEINKTSVTSWGLRPVSCKNRHPFICKLKHRYRGQDKETELQRPPLQPETPSEAIPETTPEIKHETTLETTLKPRFTPALESEVQECHNPFISGARSLSPDPENPRRMTVECWSGTILKLTCSRTTGRWELNGSDIVVCCGDGYKMDSRGKCVDVDECRTSPCRGACMNTEGSFQCVCYDQEGNRHMEGSPACLQPIVDPPHAGDDQAGTHDFSLSGVLTPVLIAVGVLVVLVVVVVFAVKCCRMRRSKKRGVNKAQKMTMRSKEETNKDSVETTNEKEAR